MFNLINLHMTSIFFNSSSHTYSPYPSDHHEDHLGNHQFSNPNSQALSSSSNSLATHLFLNSAVDDQSGTFDRDIQPSQYQQEGDNFKESQAYNDHSIESNDSKSVEVSTWGRNGINDDMINNDQNQMKWMSSKTRVMLKMKKSDPVNIKFYSSATREIAKHEDHKSPTCYRMEETDNSSNSTSSNNSNIPIRVCSDCNTTKTPLWRSGPQGPKSLCNACGIRQRKARRALAIAAGGNGNCNILGDQSMIMAPLKVTKTQLKDFNKKPNNGQVTKYKKRQYSKHIKTTTMVTTITTPPSSRSPSPSPSPLPSPSSSSLVRKNCVEDFLVSLSKNLTFNYHVFPQDEKEAAILLMAISCGYAHET